MAYLEYDSDIINETKTFYETKAQAMGDIKTALVNMESNLRTDWESDASRAFFDHFDNEWMNNFDTYKETLEHMATLLGTAAASYDSVTTTAENVML